MSLHSSFNREAALWVWPPAIRAANLHLNNAYVLRRRGRSEEGEWGRSRGKGRLHSVGWYGNGTIIVYLVSQSFLLLKLVQNL